MLSFVAAASPSMGILIWMRALQAVAWSVAITGMSTWYIEFLPTKGRGTLMAAYSLGWPLGRGLVILTASLTDEAWQPLMLLGAAGFAALSVTMFFATESPRFLVAKGRLSEANAVLGHLYRVNGQDAWDPETRLCLDQASGCQQIADNTIGHWTGVNMLFRTHRRLLVFALTLFGILASTTTLLDTWGPEVYREMLSPTDGELPHGVLALFNLGDLAGTVLSMFVIDRIGRFGSFVIGFFVQGSFLLIMGSSSSMRSAVCVMVLGTLASSCRSFGWESAQMWTLEAFPTEVRALALGIATAFMRILSIGSLKISASYVGYLRPEQSLQILGTLLLCGGVISTMMLPKETAKLPISEGISAPPADWAQKLLP
ncbi:unnamed protein product [Polarella glacialis]|uniref:Major facilitator superfamily (MFS) profile domain-containing protein n=1 Tax=Polarella glacialis TaxID=89957 RepID=A0A813D799_POLGL|nr:unnamed protein product [Polarella glacialis]